MLTGFIGLYITWCMMLALTSFCFYRKVLKVLWFKWLLGTWWWSVYSVCSVPSARALCRAELKHRPSQCIIHCTFYSDTVYSYELRVTLNEFFCRFCDKRMHALWSVAYLFVICLLCVCCSQSLELLFYRSSYWLQLSARCCNFCLNNSSTDHPQ